MGEASHATFQQLVNKEQRALHNHINTYVKGHGAQALAQGGDPFDNQHTAALSMHRTWSVPALSNNKTRAAGAVGDPTGGIGPLMQPDVAGGRTPILRKVASERGSTGSSSQMYALDESGRPVTNGLPPQTGLRSRSCTSASRSRLQTGASGRTRSSAMSGMSSASLRREIQEAVQEEIAKAMGPLKGQLDPKAADASMERKRLEEMLAKARGRPPN